MTNNNRPEKPTSYSDDLGDGVREQPSGSASCMYSPSGKHVGRQICQYCEEEIPRSQTPTSASTRNIDSKFSTDGKLIFNTVSGEEIPLDEPLFLLRARDVLAVHTLRSYHASCLESGCNDLHLAGIMQVIRKFEKYAASSDRMKQPGVTKHLKLEDAGDHTSKRSAKEWLDDPNNDAHDYCDAKYAAACVYEAYKRSRDEGEKELCELMEAFSASLRAELDKANTFIARMEQGQIAVEKNHASEITQLKGELATQEPRSTGDFKRDLSILETWALNRYQDSGDVKYLDAALDARIGLKAFDGDCELTWKRRAEAAESTIERLNKALEQKWTPVSERLPEEGKPVLIFTRARVRLVAERIADGGNWTWLSSMGQYDQSVITHWMPLPSPPEVRAALPSTDSECGPNKE